MPVPNPVRLFHMTAIANLPAILTTGAIVSKNSGASAGIAYQNIVHSRAQGTRAAKRIPDPPGGSVHDYAPFYFARRSPMLMAIHGGKADGCALKQEDIVCSLRVHDGSRHSGRYAVRFLSSQRHIGLQYRIHGSRTHRRSRLGFAHGNSTIGWLL